MCSIRPHEVHACFLSSLNPNFKAAVLPKEFCGVVNLYRRGHALYHISVYCYKPLQEVQDILTPGEVYPYPYNIDTFKRDKLGEGGNGKVIKWPLQNREFALKHVS